MNKHTQGPLFVTVQNEWPFKIVTKDANGEIVFSRDMPCFSTSQETAAEALAGKGIDPEWNAAEINEQALADEVLRAAAPELLAACIEFVRKCDAGEAKSKRSYAQMVAAIAKATQI